MRSHRGNHNLRNRLLRPLRTHRTQFGNAGISISACSFSTIVELRYPFGNGLRCILAMPMACVGSHPLTADFQFPSLCCSMATVITFHHRHRSLETSSEGTERDTSRRFLL